MPFHPSRRPRGPQRPAEKEREKEAQGPLTGGAGLGAHESPVTRTFLPTGGRYSSTPSLKSARLDKAHHYSSLGEVRSSRESQDEADSGRSHDLKRRSSAMGLMPLDRPPIPREIGLQKDLLQVVTSDTESSSVATKENTDATAKSTSKRCRRDSATSDRTVSPTVRTKKLSVMNKLGDAQEEPKKTPSRRRSSHGQARSKLKSSTSRTALIEDDSAASQATTGTKSDVPTISEEKPPSRHVSHVSPTGCIPAAAEHPECSEPATTRNPPVPQPTKGLPPMVPIGASRKAPSPPRAQTPRREHLAILGPLAHFIPNPASISFPIPPPPSPPLPPTIIPLQKSPKNATRVRFGDTTVHTYTITINLGRHLTPIGPNQFKTRSGLSYLHPSTPSLGKKPRMGLRIIDFFPSGKLGAKQRRHRERQAAMRRYWLRIEEEEKLEREECVRKAEGVVERYAKELEPRVRLEEANLRHEPEVEQLDVGKTAPSEKGAQQDRKISLNEEVNEKEKNLLHTENKDCMDTNIPNLGNGKPVLQKTANTLLANAEEKRLTSI
ncbi:hypothetical protein DL546_006270 [Coniochaeta pulveracea]|uniref:Uncharacterized protein n=1 Tax=Coniochaeta pulveracea TaxID=177199 RepID=A0A420Y936_9PEZI|nr:hypothetical protein DL546_006270 [Coniochaeta pulveracea]